MFFIIALMVQIFSLNATPSINTNNNCYTQLENLNLIKKNAPVKIHLGCGETYFNGYINIDFPPSEHTAQRTVKANVFGDINKLKFPAASIDEFRSHHVFEHFDRATALALLCAWYKALKPNGIVYIETPDFKECIKLILSSNLTYAQQQSVMRHLFGSHEAQWAVHWDGWYKDKFKKTLTKLGFSDIQIEKTSWQFTRNIIVKARKTTNYSNEQLYAKAKQLLRDSMVDNSQSEQYMWQIWCGLFDFAIKNMSIE